MDNFFFFDFSICIILFQKTFFFIPALFSSVFVIYLLFKSINRFAVVTLNFIVFIYFFFCCVCCWWVYIFVCSYSIQVENVCVDVSVSVFLIIYAKKLFYYVGSFANVSVCFYVVGYTIEWIMMNMQHDVCSSFMHEYSRKKYDYFFLKKFVFF